MCDRFTKPADPAGPCAPPSLLRQVPETCSGHLQDHTTTVLGLGPATPRHYDLVVDSTRVAIETCTELIVTAARSCGGRRA